MMPKCRRFVLSALSRLVCECRTCKKVKCVSMGETRQSYWALSRPTRGPSPLCIVRPTLGNLWMATSMMLIDRLIPPTLCELRMAVSFAQGSGAQGS
jgi:hypothetical protein